MRDSTMQSTESVFSAASRVLVLDTLSWRPHLETSLEIALLARERGARVRYLNFRRTLAAIEDASWLPRALDLNTLRVGRAKRLLRDAGVETAEAGVTQADRVQAAASARSLLRACADTAALRQLRTGSFDDIGWGVLSSVVEVTRNPFASLQAHAGLFEGFLASALLVYGVARRAIREFAPDTVVLFNGRYASTRAIYAAARAEGVRPAMHERGCDKDHYWIATEPIHDPDYIQRCIREFWRPELAAAGEEFFAGRRGRVERDWRSYTKGQTEGRIPPAMQDGSSWVVFFTSSEDEYVAIGDKYVNRAFPAQFDAIRAVEQAVRELPGHRLCVRMHPNIASKSGEQVAFWKSLAIPGGLVVGPDEDFDTYAILERARVACSYGSTVGVEATFWGRPSLLTGRSIYDRLDAAFEAAGMDDVRAFLANPRVAPRLGALMYGAFFARFGTRYRFYQPDDLFRGRIRGAYLDPLLVRSLRLGRANVASFVGAILGPR